MENSEKYENPLGTEPIKNLIVKYSIPTALTLMVNYIYNIVDQIFIGQGVGIEGMAATNVAFPLTIISIAIALLIGDGCAANISLCLGRKEQDTADRTVSHASTMLVVSGIIIAVVCFLFAGAIANVFGSTDTAFNQSVIYIKTISWGLPFLMLSSALTAIIRADGNPQYTMKCMIIGCIINIILDPVFIFVFDMGVFGAGIATVIGEAYTGIACFTYLKRLKTVHIKKEALIPTPALSFKILSLGIPSLLTQIMNALVQITMNNLMSVYGSKTIYGGDTALSVYGMMMKVYQIAHSMFVGVSSATQPINGYNFGAKNYKRVYETYKMAVKIAITISIIWFAVYQIFPRFIAMMFVSDDAIYIDCAEHIFRIYMAVFFIYGLHLVTASFLQSIGKPTKALLIPIIRQAVFLIPLSIILSSKFGLNGAVMAAPIADMAVFIVALTLAVTEFRTWKKNGLI